MYRMWDMLAFIKQNSHSRGSQRSDRIQLSQFRRHSAVCRALGQKHALDQIIRCQHVSTILQGLALEQPRFVEAR